MKQFVSILTLAAFGAVPALAQDSAVSISGNSDRREEIVIRQNGNKDAKIVVEIRDGKVYINGKPSADFRNEDLTVHTRPLGGPGGSEDVDVYSLGSPFRDEAWQRNFDRNLQRQMADVDRQMADVERRLADKQFDSDRQMDLQRRAMENARRGMRSYDWQKMNRNGAFLGVRYEAKDSAARIAEVLKGSAAEKAGLKSGDVITKIDEYEVADARSLQKIIAQYKPENKVRVTYTRGGKTKTAMVVLGRMEAPKIAFDRIDVPDAPDNDMAVPPVPDNDFTVPPAPVPPVPDAAPRAYKFDYRFRGDEAPRLGIRAQDTEDGNGISVLGVDDNSAAAKAGLKKGDLITSFNGEKLNNADELVEKYEAARKSATLKLGVLRDGQPKELEVKVPHKLRSADL